MFSTPARRALKSAKCTERAAMSVAQTCLETGAQTIAAIPVPVPISSIASQGSIGSHLANLRVLSRTAGYTVSTGGMHFTPAGEYPRSQAVRTPPAGYTGEGA